LYNSDRKAHGGKESKHKASCVKSSVLQTPTSHHLTETFEQANKFVFIGLSGTATVFNLNTFKASTLDIQISQSELI
jgi:hypothetical protein